MLRDLLSIADGDNPIHEPLTLFFVQLIIVVGLSKLVSHLFRYIKQPTVIAEVVTGILLGPSVFGRIPGFQDHLFPTESLTVFGVIANVGLVLFMFMVGLEIDVKLMKSSVSKSVLISACGISASFSLGVLSSWIIHSELVDSDVSFASFLLFVGVAMAVTAFPVLARILTETKLLSTRIGNLTLSAAACDDVVSWCVLALVVSIARAKSPLGALWTFLLLIGFILIMFIGARTLLSRIAINRQSSGNSHTGLRIQVVTGLLILVFFCSWITEIIGVHAIFGSFILGVVTPRKGRFAECLTERIEDLVVIVLLPLYFTFSGLRTDIGALNSPKAWGLTILIICAAVTGKIGGATAAARFLKNGWRDSFTVGILMNTKGLVELIVLNVGLDIGVLNTQVFTMFVIMALVTTFLTTPLLHLVYIRHNKGLVNKVSASKHPFATLISAYSVKTARKITTIAAIFSNGNGMLLKILLLKEISDRPSSFFFSEVYNNMTQQKVLLPGTKDRKEKKNTYSDLITYAQSLDKGIIAEPKIMITSKPEDDLIDYTTQRVFDIVLFHLHSSDRHAQQPGDNERESRDMRFSISIGRAFSWDQTALNTVNNALRKIPTKVSVLFSSHGSPFPETINKILFIWSGKEYERACLHLVQKRIPETIEVTIFARDATSITKEEVTKNMTVIQAGGDGEWLQEIKKNYDLLLLGQTRRRSMAELTHNEYIESSPVPVLVVFPTMEASEGSVVDLPEIVVT